MSTSICTAAEAVADVPDGATIAFGGFGLSGVPFTVIDALLQAGATDLEAVSNNAGVDGVGLGRLLAAGRLRRIVASYVGENHQFADRYLQGELEVELLSQGTLAEKMRAGGCGIPAFYTPAGVGTLIAEGGLPWRYDSSGDVAVASPPKEVRALPWRGQPKEFVLESAIVADYAVVRAHRGDADGNLVFRRAARNFNPIAAMCGRVTIAEVEELVPAGALDPDEVHLPGIFVHRVVPLTAAQAAEKRIEKRTVRTTTDGDES